MLNAEDIMEALHASRVVVLKTGDPHGPIGLEQLAAEVERILTNSTKDIGLVSGSISLRAGTWKKLDDLARKTAKESTRKVTASDVASVLLEQLIESNLP